MITNRATSPFCVLSGLFAGIAAAATNLIFVFAYRGITQFYLFNGIDVTVIVFGSLLPGIVCGIIFFMFVHYLHKGVAVYRLMVVIVLPWDEITRPRLSTAHNV